MVDGKGVHIFKSYNVVFIQQFQREEFSQDLAYTYIKNNPEELLETCQVVPNTWITLSSEIMDSGVSRLGPVWQGSWLKKHKI